MEENKMDYYENEQQIISFFKTHKRKAILVGTRQTRVSLFSLCAAAS